MLSKTINIKLPVYLLKTAYTINQHGYKVYLVGGALRDTLLNSQSSDYDLATDALPKTIQKIFPESVDVGIKFGTIVVPIYNPTQRKYYNIEITTMRTENQYKDFRHPEKINFITKIEDDLSRRDFTINAMALELNIPKLPQYKSLLQKPEFEYLHITAPLIDPFHGLNDLKNKIIRAVGDPLQRFNEDPLRIIRACRFSAQLNFEIEPKTLKAMKKALKYLPHIATERIQSEIIKLLKQAKKPSKAFYCLHKIGALQMIIPELTNLIGVTQPIGHIHDVFDHTMAALDLTPKNVILRLAVLFHDIAKPYTKLPDGHFYGHDIKGAKLTAKILKRLRFSNNTIKKVANLVRWHMFHYQPDIWTDSAVRRFIRNVGEENIPLLFELRKADALSNPKQLDPNLNLSKFEQHINKVKQQELALSRKDLNISGQDLIQELHLKPSPLIGQILDYLLEKVIDNPKLNNKKQLLQLAKQYLQSQIKN